MCGIAGFLGFEDKNLLKRMCDALAYRGPDDSGFYTDNDVSLGHTRLSIIDLSSRGKQPIHNEDETIWITYNGEIYNYPVLKKELESRGHRFYTNTDTEVIIHAYEEYGEDCVKRLKGMFAFAIWDSNNKHLFLARDRLGIKPLYYAIHKDKFLFASEIKAILLCSEIARRLDRGALAGFMVFGYTPGEKTIFGGISKLLPGNTLLYNIKSKEVTSKEYWDVDFSHVEQNNEAYFIKEVIDNLRESVEAHLVSDVPLGVFLSGGVDSSSIAALMMEVTDAPIKTFTIGFEDTSYDESAYARTVAETLGTGHYERIISPEEVLRIIEKLAPALDEPFGDVSMFPTYMLSTWARREVKAVLDGDGGDEIFAGYHWYQAQRMGEYYSYMPKRIRKAMAFVASKLEVSESKKGTRTLMKRFVEGASLEPELKHVRWKVPSFSKVMLPGDWQGTIDEIHECFKKAKRWHPVNQMLYVDIKTSLPNDMLAKVDRMSMLNSLEVRVPFLDHNFVEFTAKIPPSLKLKNLETKYILKKAMSGLLPKEVLYRNKQGFSIPMKNWLKGELKSTMLDLLSEKNIKKRGHFDWYHVNKLTEQHIRGERDNWHLLWRLMSLEIWHRNYIAPSRE